MIGDRLPYSPIEGGILLAVRVTPRAKRDSIHGTIEGADGRPLLAVRLNAPPVDGAANKALIAFLAQVLGVGRSALLIRSGETGRFKIVEVTGVTVEEFTRRLESRTD